MPQQRIPIEDRLWPRVRKDESGCWLWTGAKKQGGYGKISAGGDNGWVLTHRVAWELTNGLIPAGLMVCHRCDVPACCNPGHLFLGTARDNMQDMIAKGRHCHGEAMSRAVKAATRRPRTSLPPRNQVGRFYRE